MKPVTVTTLVERPISEVYEHLATLGKSSLYRTA